MFLGGLTLCCSRGQLCRVGHIALHIDEPRLDKRYDVFALRVGAEMDVRIALQQQNKIVVLHEKNQRIGVLTAKMQMHDARLLQ